MLDYQCIIIGSGPAGLTAATYLQSGGVKTLLVGNSHGGQMRKSGMLENLPFLGGTVVRGWSHAARMVTQCDKFGVVTMQDIVTNLHSQAPDKGWRVDTKHNGSIYAPTVLLATGVYPKQIHLTDNTHPHLHYLPDLDSVGHLGGQTVTIVGGGNSAAQAALYAAGKGAQVTMLARQPIATTMSQYMWDRINRHPKILVRGGTQIVKATHVGRVGYTVLGDNTYTLHNYDADQVWVYAGLQPRTQWLANVVKRDDLGYIVTAPNRYNVQPSQWSQWADAAGAFDTLFCIGDVRSGSVKRCAVAVGEAAAAAAHIAVQLGQGRNADNQA